MKGGGTIMHSFGGFTRFVSRPCRDAGLSRHCEDSVLLYRVMQGRDPFGMRKYPRYQGMLIPHYEQSGIVYQVT